MHPWRRFATLLVVSIFFSASATSTAWSLDPTGVLVLYNANSPEGTEIANYYAQVHPGVRLLGISGVGTGETITADAYLSTIRPQVQAALTSSTDVIVTTKGLPLRIQVTESAPTATWPNLPTYVDPYGQSHSILSWKSYSSLESELTAVDTIASWQMMGDQSFSIGGQFTTNPYYLSNASFSHAAFGSRLTARLDGFSTTDVIATIDRAQNAFVGPANSPSGPMHFIVDSDPAKNYGPTTASLVNNVLHPAGMPVTYDNTGAFVSSTDGPLMGYVSFGRNQSSTPPNYIVNGLNIEPADGAVFHTWESYNAYSFQPGGNVSGQGLVAEWLARGGTAGTGHVQEPGGSSSSVTNEDKMFQMLLQGKTWAEAVWSATRQLSYVNTLVGDPLMTWKTLLAGDVNRDGQVDFMDLAAIGSNWGSNSASGGYGWTNGDLNSDGRVDFSDLAIMGSTWGQTANWANGSAFTAGIDAAQLSLLFPATTDALIPEPSSLVLAAVAIGGLGFVARRRVRGRKAHACVARQFSRL
jgi:uncharacterized protein (TIGR03790 family)